MKLRQVFVLIVSFILTGCSDYVTPRAWDEAQRQCATHGGLLYVTQSPLVSNKWTRIVVRCADHTDIEKTWPTKEKQ